MLLLHKIDKELLNACTCPYRVRSVSCYVVLLLCLICLILYRDSCLFILHVSGSCFPFRKSTTAIEHYVIQCLKFKSVHLKCGEVLKMGQFTKCCFICYLISLPTGYPFLKLRFVRLLSVQDRYVI